MEIRLIKCWRCHRIFDAQNNRWLEQTPEDSLDRLKSSNLLKAVGVDLSKAEIDDSLACSFCQKEIGKITKIDIKHSSL